MIRPIKAIILRNLIKLGRDRMKLFLNLFMSGLFLFIFSFAMKFTTLQLEQPMDYLISGIIIMTVLQSSLSNSMSILEDITSGFMKEILVAPIARWQIAIGHVLSSSIVSVIQGVIVMFSGIILGFHIDLSHGIIMLGLMFLVGLTFSSLGLFLATIAKESSNFQLLIMLITFPLTFLSGAYIPIMAFPSFLLPLIYINPLTYTTAAFRFVALHMENLTAANLLKVGVSFDVYGFLVTPFISLLIIIAMFLLFFVLCVNMFNTADFSKVKIFKRSR